MHHLRPAPGAKKAKTRKGRGEASKGKTSGRGGKGTHARNTVRAGFEGGQMPLHMRLPKLRAEVRLASLINRKKIIAKPAANDPYFGRVALAA